MSPAAPELSRSVLFLLLFSVLSAASTGVHLTPGNTTKVLSEVSCGTAESCVKLDLLRVYSRLRELSHGVTLYRGLRLTISRSQTDGEEAKEATAASGRLRSLALSPSGPSLEVFAQELLAHYLASLTLSLQVGQSGLLDRLGLLSGRIWPPARDSFIGRAVRKHKAWYAIGSMAAVAFALLAALAGKALMASIIALALSALVALRGGAGFGNPPGVGYHSPSSPGRVTQYEIISRPVSYATAPAAASPYADHEHHHTSATTAYRRGIDGSKEE